MLDRCGVFQMLLALAMLGVLACACSKSQTSMKSMLLDRMHQLTKASALTVELIRDTLEVDFVKDADTSHEMVTFFIGKPRPGSLFKDIIKLIDCRVPTKRNTVLRELFLVVELQQAKERLLPSDLVDRFGEPDSYLAALPENPINSGSYIYKAGSRSLWMGLSRKTPEQVLEISIHPLEDAP